MLLKATLSDGERRQADALDWRHHIRLAEDYVTQGKTTEDIGAALSTRGVPDDCRGMRILDVACWDGGYAFECERRGAEVVGIDIWQGAQLSDEPIFTDSKLHFAKEVLQSDLVFAEVDAVDAAEYFGENSFDIVLCFGLLYHVKSPLHVIESLCAASRSTICVETARADDTGRPDWLYAKGNPDDETIWWYPTEAGLIRAFAESGFGVHTPKTKGPHRMACVFERGVQ